MLRVGIVAEGKSDWLALEEFLGALHPDLEFERIRPDLTLESRSPYGWRGVRAWCRDNGPRLEALMKGVTTRPLHLLLVHSDCSMAHNEDADRPCPPPSATADALRQVMLSSWLCRDDAPVFLVLVTPSLQTDTWIAAALDDPPYAGPVPLECSPHVEAELARRHLLPRKQGEVKKPEKRYAPLARLLAARIETVCTRCSQAERLKVEFAKAAAAL
jgi:hypothetical protein